MPYRPPQEWLNELLQHHDNMVESLICEEIDVVEATKIVNHFFTSFGCDPEKYRRYPMGPDQPAQVDCRITVCKYHGVSNQKPCTNVAPAITLNPDGSFTCWSRKE